MKTALTALALTVSLGAATMACSSSSSSERVDTQSALASLRSPTGTFSSQNGKAAFAGYSSKRADSSKVSTGSGGGSGTSRAQGLRILNQAAAGEAACTDGQACACEKSGSMTYTHESSADGDLLRIAFDACVSEDGEGFDGEAVLLASKKPLLGVKEGSKTSSPASTEGDADQPSAGDAADDGLSEAQPETEAGDDFALPEGVVSLMLAAKGTAIHSGGKTPLELAMVTEAGYVYLSVTVPDGNVVIGLAKDGSAVVKPKDQTWTCSPAGQSYTCQSGDGEKLEIDASEDAADDGASAGEGSSDGSEDPALPSEEEESSDEL